MAWEANEDLSGMLRRGIGAHSDLPPNRFDFIPKLINYNLNSQENLTDR